MIPIESNTAGPAPVPALRARSLGALLVGLAAASLVAAQQREDTAPEPSTVLFEDVAVVDVVAGATREHRAVLTAGGEIVDVRAAGDSWADQEIAARAARIDGSGLFLIPGLADMHVHNWQPTEHEVYLAFGVTRVRNLFGVPLHLRFREQSAAGERPMPRYTTAGPIVDGDPPIWPNSRKVTDAATGRAAVAEQKEAGYDFVKIYNRVPREAFFALAEEARERGVPFGGHVPDAVTLEEALTSGMRFIEHLTGTIAAAQGADAEWSKLSEEERQALDRYQRTALLAGGVTEEGIARVVEASCAAGVWHVPTLLVQERIRGSAADKARWSELDAMRWVDPMSRRMWNPSNDFRLQDVSEEQLAAARSALPVYRRIVKALHDAGCELMLGTDTPNPFVFPGFSVHEELQRFVDAGLEPAAALRLATWAPARFLGVEDREGRVAPGYVADLVLLGSDPTVDIAASRDLRGVMIRGTWLDRGALDRMLESAAERYDR